MARARKNRKQWRPKAAIESAAAQHRSNANHLVTSFFQGRQDSTNPTITNETFDHNISTKPNKPLIASDETVPLTNNTDRNTLMLQLSTPALSPAIRASINVTSSSGDQLDDDERDDIALFVHQEQQENNKKNNKNEHDNQIEILPSTTATSNVKFNNPLHFKTTTRSSQTENHHNSQSSAKRFKTRLKTKPDSRDSTVTTNITQPNNTKIAKRKAYSRMKKERKATQTLIIVLSMLFISQ
jgi:hypothetical protein